MKDCMYNTQGTFDEHKSQLFNVQMFRILERVVYYNLVYKITLFQINFNDLFLDSLSFLIYSLVISFCYIFTLIPLSVSSWMLQEFSMKFSVYLTSQFLVILLVAGKFLSVSFSVYSVFTFIKILLLLCFVYFLVLNHRD